MPANGKGHLVTLVDGHGPYKELAAGSRLANGRKLLMWDEGHVEAQAGRL